MKTALIMAGGTGGHIFPGLALAEALRDKNWAVHWLGARASMEEELVKPKGFQFEAIQFSGLRGKGWKAKLTLPIRLLAAFWQSIVVVRRVRPDVVVGMGGYISFPAGMMSVLLGKSLILHEQNSVAGLANRVLALVADQIFATFPGSLRGAVWIGNPLRKEFLEQAAPSQRMRDRQGNLRLLVLGGSLGAKALNENIPQALSKIPVKLRPHVTHQGGAKQIDELRKNYAQVGVQAELTAFITNTAIAIAEADYVICRAGASTVSEIAAIGASAVFVPYPFAVDDHQTQNARFLSHQEAAQLITQQELTEERLIQILQNQERFPHVLRAEKAYLMRKIDATEHLVRACEQIAEKQV